MTPEKQRIAIADACPHLVEKHDDIYYWKGSWSAVGQGNEHFAIFDPLNDLNAMHEAEMALGLKYVQWTRELRAICERDRRCVESATAAQRAEAFLRTIGKWEESA